jgi:hypothetical protein
MRKYLQSLKKIVFSRVVFSKFSRALSKISLISSCCFFSSSVYALNIYFTDGDSRIAYDVNTSNLSYSSFDTSAVSSGYGLTVLNNIISISARNGSGAAAYSLSGALLSIYSYPSNLNVDQLIDGATDGAHNYGINCFSRGGSQSVFISDLNWNNQQVLFNLPAGVNGTSITYDSNTKSLWTLVDFGGTMINYSLAGIELSRFTADISRFGAGGLAYDPMTNTLWLYDKNGHTLHNYTKSGTLINSINIPGWSPLNIYGMEIAFFSGPDPLNTQSSMQYQASQLRSAFNTQTVAANFALNYDCNVFDAKGMCISAGGRYTTIDNPGINNLAAVVTLGYKVNSNIRIGAYLDQNINISNPTGINISNNTPLMGAYAVWNKEQNGLGYQVRLANTYQDKDVTSTRTVFDTSEAGSGKSSLTSQSYLAELSYAFQYEDKTLVRPYAGLRYTHLKQDGYTEETVTGSVDNPLIFASLKDRSATALIGVKINRNLTDKATLTAQLGLEQDLYHKVDNYSATDLNGSDLTAVAFNSNIKRTRPVASLGAFYDVTKTQRASATINYQQTPFQSTGSATAYFNYMIGF